MTMPNDLQQLIESLDLQAGHVRTMLDILQREHAALVQRDLQAFDAVMQDKQEQLRVLESLEPQLAPLQALLARHSGDKAMHGFIDSISNTGQRQRFAALWAELREQLEACRRQNAINNRVIQSSRANIQQAIAILRGDNGQPNLYGASGKQHENNRGQSLAVA